MHCILETSGFESDARKIGLDHDDKHMIMQTIANDPAGGDLISGTGGARKRRFAKADNCERGSFRVVWYYGSDDVPVFLLAAFDKGQKISLSKAEKAELEMELASIESDYKDGVQQRVSQIKRTA